MLKTPDNDASSENAIRDRVLSLIGDGHGNAQLLLRVLNVKSKNIVTEWRSGRSKSYMKYIPQIAAFYSVSADWILGSSTEKNPTQKEQPTVSDELRIPENLSDDKSRAIQFILEHSNDEVKRLLDVGAVMFDK